MLSVVLYFALFVLSFASPAAACCCVLESIVYDAADWLRSFAPGVPRRARCTVVESTAFYAVMLREMRERRQASMIENLWPDLAGTAALAASGWVSKPLSSPI